MRKVFGLVIAFGFASIAAASDLNMNVNSGGVNLVQVDPGDVVPYQVVGELSDDVNEGLALVGFDLCFDGGPLTQAFEPTTFPMKNFATGTEKLGINNPAGYGGTVLGGCLIQVGGGQNTIKNVFSNAPFPLGAVMTGVAQPGSPVVLIEGELTAPLVEGDYQLTLSNVFGNVIVNDDDGDPFWRTAKLEENGTIDNLIVRVVVSNNTPNIVSSTPTSGSIDARQPSKVDGADPIGWTSVEINFDGDFSGAVAGDFDVSTVGPGSAPGFSVVPAGSTVTVNFDSHIPAGSWTVITVVDTGDKVCLGYLPGDVNGDRTSAPLDILRVIDCLNGAAQCALYQGDLDRSGESNAQDILRVIDLLNGASEFEVWNGVSLANSPCGSE